MRDPVTESDHETRAKATEFSIGARAKSFGHAFAGIALVVRSQHNAWIHSVATLLVVGIGALLPLSALEWCVLLLAIALVWVAEAINTALELLADAVNPQPHPLVGQAKDVAAGAVLIAALAAAGVGLIVLGPHCLDLIGV
jgi:diacylglycerol kinase (ATP)